MICASVNLLSFTRNFLLWVGRGCGERPYPKLSLKAGDYSGVSERLSPSLSRTKLLVAFLTPKAGNAVSGAKGGETGIPRPLVMLAMLAMLMLAVLPVLKPKPMVPKTTQTMIRTKPPMPPATMPAEADAKAMRAGPAPLLKGI